MRYLVFLWHYINVPAGNSLPTPLKNLEKIIEMIGRKYGTIKGSDFAKGKYYIKRSVPGCNTRHIKLMLKAVENVLTRNETDPQYVWRMHKDTYSEIFNIIINFVIENKPVCEKALCCNFDNKKNTYSEIFIREPMIGLNYVCNEGRTKKIRNKAQELFDKISMIDRRK